MEKDQHQGDPYQICKDERDWTRETGPSLVDYRPDALQKATAFVMNLIKWGIIAGFRRGE